MPLHNKSSYPRYHCYLMTKKRFIAFHSQKSYYFYQCQKIPKNAKKYYFSRSFNAFLSTFSLLLSGKVGS